MLVFTMMVATTTTTILHVNIGDVKDHKEKFGHGRHGHGTAMVDMDMVDTPPTPPFLDLPN